jgi:hypothetical protein
MLLPSSHLTLFTREAGLRGSRSNSLSGRRARVRGGDRFVVSRQAWAIRITRKITSLAAPAVLLVRTGIARAARREQMRNHRPAGVPSEPVCCVRKQVALRARCEQKSQVSLDRAAVAPSEVTIRGKEKEAPMPTRCPHDAHAPETKKTTNPSTTVPARPLLRHNPSTNKVTSLFTFHSKLSTKL